MVNYDKCYLMLSKQLFALILAFCTDMARLLLLVNLLKCIYNHQWGDGTMEPPEQLKELWETFKKWIDEGKKRYAETIEARSRAGKRSAEKRTTPKA